jgi:hypothetical protein
MGFEGRTKGMKRMAPLRALLRFRLRIYASIIRRPGILTVHRICTHPLHSFRPLTPQPNILVAGSGRASEQSDWKASAEGRQCDSSAAYGLQMETWQERVPKTAKTATGWVSGTSKVGDTILGQAIERPAETVETWVEEMVIPYPQCADVYAWRLIWFDESVSLAERKKLRKRFPKPSEDFPL